MLDHSVDSILTMIAGLKNDMTFKIHGECHPDVQIDKNETDSFLFIRHKKPHHKKFVDSMMKMNGFEVCRFDTDTVSAFKIE